MSVLKSFRYRPINEHLWSSLTESELYFTEPHRLNDPYDCQVDVMRTLRRAADTAQDAKAQALQKVLGTDAFIRRIQNDIVNFGVCCFSHTLLNSVMWSHYADAHRGVCLYYEIPASFIGDPESGIFGYSPVTYGDDALFDWIITTNALDNSSSLDGAIEVMKKVLTTKGSDWAYEEEARIIRPSGGTMKIPPEFLKQICFGLRTPDKDKKQLLNTVRESYNDVHFAAIRHEDSKDFGLAVYSV